MNHRSKGRKGLLHLIGLNHDAQERRPNTELTDAQRVFAECLRTAILEIRPAFIGEEDSEENLRALNRISIAKGIADEQHIEHRFCDPNPAERDALGYRDGQSLELEIFMSDEDGLSNDEIFCKARAIEIVRLEYTLFGIKITITSEWESEEHKTCKSKE